MPIVPTPEQMELFRLVQTGVCEDTCRGFFERYPGADPNFSHTGGGGPLHVAAERNDCIWMKALFEHGASGMFSPVRGQIPLEHMVFHIAREGFAPEQYRDAFELLVPRSADACEGATCSSETCCSVVCKRIISGADLAFADQDYTIMPLNLMGSILSHFISH